MMQIFAEKDSKWLQLKIWSALWKTLLVLLGIAFGYTVSIYQLTSLHVFMYHQILVLKFFPEMFSTNQLQVFWSAVSPQGAN